MESDLATFLDTSLTFKIFQSRNMCQSSDTLIKAWGLFLKTLSIISALLLWRFKVGHRHSGFDELIFNFIGTVQSVLRACFVGIALTISVCICCVFVCARMCVGGCAHLCIRTIFFFFFKFW